MSLSEEREALEEFYDIEGQLRQDQLTPEDSELRNQAGLEVCRLAHSFDSVSSEDVTKGIKELTEKMRALLVKQRQNLFDLGTLLSAQRNSGFQQAEQYLFQVPTKVLSQYLGQWLLVDPSGILCGKSTKSAARSVADSNNLKDGGYIIREITPEFLQELQNPVVAE